MSSAPGGRSVGLGTRGLRPLRLPEGVPVGVGAEREEVWGVRLHLVGFRGSGRGREGKLRPRPGAGQPGEEFRGAPAPVSSCAWLPGTGVGTGLLAALPVPNGPPPTAGAFSRSGGGKSVGGGGRAGVSGACLRSPQTEAPQDGAPRVTPEGGMGRSSGDPSAAQGQVLSPGHEVGSVFRGP